MKREECYKCKFQKNTSIFCQECINTKASNEWLKFEEHCPYFEFEEAINRPFDFDCRDEAPEDYLKRVMAHDYYEEVSEIHNNLIESNDITCIKANGDLLFYEIVRLLCRVYHMEYNRELNDIVDDTKMAEEMYKLFLNKISEKE